MILKPTETESLLHGTLASFALLLPNEPLLWCQEAHSSALLEDFRGTRKDRQGLKCLRKDMALYNPQRRSSSNSRTPRHTHAHMCAHTHTHLLPECPVPAAPAPSGAAQEQGPHCSQEGPLGRRHRKGVQGHHSTWHLCRPVERSPCKDYGQMDQAQLPFQDSFSLVQNSQNCSRRR